MRKYTTITAILLLLACHSSYGTSPKQLVVAIIPTASDQSPTTFEQWKRPKKIKQQVMSGRNYSYSEVESEGKKQSLDFEVTGLHPKECRTALRKLSRYENFSQYISFVTVSRYNPVGKQVFFLLEAAILPIKMGLSLKLPRINKVGRYPYIFDRGFLKGLTGNINVSEYRKRCFFHVTAKWEGPHSGFPDMVFELFSSTLADIGMSKLFRISSH
jgi:hypothetical protein